MRAAKHCWKGLRCCAIQVPKRLASPMRVCEPLGLRVPPLILRATTNEPEVSLVALADDMMEPPLSVRASEDLHRALDVMLDKIALFYEQEVEATVASLTFFRWSVTRWSCGRSSSKVNFRSDFLKTSWSAVSGQALSASTLTRTSSKKMKRSIPGICVRKPEAENALRILS